MQEVGGEASKVIEEEDEIFLQTKTISLQEVRKSLPLRSRRRSKTSTTTRPLCGSMRSRPKRSWLKPKKKVSEPSSCQEWGSSLERLAMDAVDRGLCAVETIWKPNEIYASGADSTQLRMILRVASLQQWHCLSLDVKSAFLLASKAQGETVVVKPPKILEEAGLAQPGEHWLVSAAMCGLVTSPKDWSSFRDAELQKMLGSYMAQWMPAVGEIRSFALVFGLWRIQTCGRSKRWRATPQPGKEAGGEFWAT